MKCSDFLQELTNYLDGVLDENTKIELENHLSWCHNCYVVCDTTKKTIQGLPPGFRTVFVLRDVEGLSTEETAAALELSVPAVKSRLLRARLQLRERLGRYFQRRESSKDAEAKNGESKGDVTSGDGNP